MQFLAALLLLLPSALCFNEQAPYTVIADHGDWQEREYPPTRWVSTDAVDIFVHDGPAHSKAFARLFHFIDGTNSEEQKIEMTAPVTYRILPGEGPNCSSNYTMSFFVPAELQENTPKPTDPLVYLEDRPAFKVVTKEFPGFPEELDWSIQAAELYELATAEGFSPKDIPLWTGGYSGPGIIINRRNEVWLEL